MNQRIKPHVVVTKYSPNQSARTSKPSLIVLHSTEGHNRPGVSDLQGLGGWFANSASQVSSHVATDADGYSARFVKDDRKAWHCGAYNGVSLGIEQVGQAAQTSWDRDEYRETARWIARWSKQHGIPIRRGRVLNGRVLLSGVVTHAQLGHSGGDHHDPGKGYRLKDVLALARFYKAKLNA